MSVLVGDDALRRTAATPVARYETSVAAYRREGDETVIVLHVTGHNVRDCETPIPANIELRVRGQINIDLTAHIAVLLGQTMPVPAVVSRETRDAREADRTVAVANGIRLRFIRSVGLDNPDVYEVFLGEFRVGMLHYSELLQGWRGRIIIGGTQMHSFVSPDFRPACRQFCADLAELDL